MNVSEFFVKSLILCFAAVITTAVIMGTIVLIAVIVDFCNEKIRKIREREESNDKS